MTKLIETYCGDNKHVQVGLLYTKKDSKHIIPVMNANLKTNNMRGDPIAYDRFNLNSTPPEPKLILMYLGIILTEMPVTSAIQYHKFFVPELKKEVYIFMQDLEFLIEVK